MKHIKLFESFSPKFLTDTKVKIYYITNPPKAFVKNCIVEVVGKNGKPYYYVTELIQSDLDGIMLPDFGGFELGTDSLESIEFTIKIEQLLDKGLSDKAHEWGTEMIATEDVTDWNEVVKDLAINDKLTDADYELLGVNKDDYKTPRNAKKFGLRK